MHASVEHTRVALAMAGNRTFVEHFDDLAQMYFGRKARKPVAALRAANGFDETGLIPNPHQLAGVCPRHTFTLAHLTHRSIHVRTSLSTLAHFTHPEHQD